MIGHSGVPQVSAAQCTNPLTKSASTNPTMNAVSASHGLWNDRGAMRSASQPIVAAKVTMLAISNRRTAGL